MDLARAKTILIVAFLVLNVILVQQIFFRQAVGDDQKSVTLQENQEVEQLLSNFNISLVEALPIEQKAMSFLELESVSILNETLSTPEYLERGVATIYQQQENRYYYRWTQDDFSSQNIISNREAILKDLDSWLTKAVYLSDYYNQGKQHYEHYPLFGHEIELVFVDDQLTEWIQHSPVRVTEIEQKTEVLAAATALRRLPEVLANKSVTVLKIEAGYYSRFTEEDIIIVPPIWRFTLDNQQQISVNALSGQIEAITERSN